MFIYKKCCVWNCNNNSINFPNLKFFHLPKNEKCFEEWIEFCCRDDLLLEAFHKGFNNHVGDICVLHFQNDMFQSDGKLIENAKPTKFNVNISIECKNYTNTEIFFDGNSKNIVQQEDTVKDEENSKRSANELNMVKQIIENDNSSYDRLSNYSKLQNSNMDEEISKSSAKELNTIENSTENNNSYCGHSSNDFELQNINMNQEISKSSAKELNTVVDRSSKNSKLENNMDEETSKAASKEFKTVKKIIVNNNGNCDRSSNNSEIQNINKDQETSKSVSKELKTAKNITKNSISSCERSSNNSEVQNINMDKENSENSAFGDSSPSDDINKVVNINLDEKISKSASKELHTVKNINKNKNSSSYHSTNASEVQNINVDKKNSQCSTSDDSSSPVTNGNEINENGLVKELNIIKNNNSSSDHLINDSEIKTDNKYEENSQSTAKGLNTVKNINVNNNSSCERLSNNSEIQNINMDSSSSDDIDNKINEVETINLDKKNSKSTAKELNIVKNIIENNQKNSDHLSDDSEIQNINIDEEIIKSEVATAKNINENNNSSCDGSRNNSEVENINMDEEINKNEFKELNTIKNTMENNNSSDDNLKHAMQSTDDIVMDNELKMENNENESMQLKIDNDNVDSCSDSDDANRNQNINNNNNKKIQIEQNINDTIKTETESNSNENKILKNSNNKVIIKNEESIELTDDLQSSNNIKIDNICVNGALDILNDSQNCVINDLKEDIGKENDNVLKNMSDDNISNISYVTRNGSDRHSSGSSRCSSRSSRSKSRSSRSRSRRSGIRSRSSRSRSRSIRSRSRSSRSRSRSSRSRSRSSRSRSRSSRSRSRSSRSRSRSSRSRSLISSSCRSLSSSSCSRSSCTCKNSNNESELELNENEYWPEFEKFEMINEIFQTKLYSTAKNDLIDSNIEFEYSKKDILQFAGIVEEKSDSSDLDDTDEDDYEINENGLIREMYTIENFLGNNNNNSSTDRSSDDSEVENINLDEEISKTTAKQLDTVKNIIESNNYSFDRCEVNDINMNAENSISSVKQLDIVKNIMASSKENTCDTNTNDNKPINNIDVEIKNRFIDKDESQEFLINENNNSFDNQKNITTEINFSNSFCANNVHKIQNVKDHKNEDEKNVKHSAIKMDTNTNTVEKSNTFNNLYDESYHCNADDSSSIFSSDDDLPLINNIQNLNKCVEKNAIDDNKVTDTSYKNNNNNNNNTTKCLPDKQSCNKNQNSIVKNGNISNVSTEDVIGYNRKNENISVNILLTNKVEENNKIIEKNNRHSLIAVKDDDDIISLPNRENIILPNTDSSLDNSQLMELDNEYNTFKINCNVNSMPTTKTTSVVTDDNDGIKDVENFTVIAVPKSIDHGNIRTTYYNNNNNNSNNNKDKLMYKISSPDQLINSKMNNIEENSNRSITAEKINNINIIQTNILNPDILNGKYNGISLIEIANESVPVNNNNNNNNNISNNDICMEIDEQIIEGYGGDQQNSCRKLIEIIDINDETESIMSLEDLRVALTKRAFDENNIQNQKISDIIKNSPVFDNESDDGNENDFSQSVDLFGSILSNNITELSTTTESITVAPTTIIESNGIAANESVTVAPTIIEAKKMNTCETHFKNNKLTNSDIIKILNDDNINLTEVLQNSNSNNNNNKENNHAVDSNINADISIQNSNFSRISSHTTMSQTINQSTQTDTSMLINFTPRAKRLKSRTKNSFTVDNEILSCPLCHQECIGKLLLQMHIQKQHNFEKKYSCDNCNELFSTATAYKNHVMKHTNILKPYKCPLCAEHFRYKPDIAKHITVHAPLSTSLETSSTSLITTSSTSLTTSTPNNKSYVHRNGTRSNCKNNIRIKLKIPYKCPVCQQKFNLYIDFLKHLKKYHHNLLPFKCKPCGAIILNFYQFIKHLADYPKHRNTLESHDQIEKLYECYICKKTFKDSFILHIHMRKIHDELNK